MSLEIVPAFGWPRCARLANAHVELLITLEVGPRVIGYRKLGGENVLHGLPDELGGSGEPEYKARGGHRLWVSPETDCSYVPDNTPVAWQDLTPDQGSRRDSGASALRLINEPVAPWLIRKTLEVALAEDSTEVTLRHTLTNEARQPATIAAWALTVVRPGGTQFIPQPPLGSHGAEFQPNRVVVPWTYTDLSDPRWALGRGFWRLRTEPGAPATKLGLLHRPGWVAYALPDALFVKTVDHVEGAAYPDFGCNYETFTKGDFLELETLSPLRTLAPGESITHEERWYLWSDVAPLDALDDAGVAAVLRPRLAQIPLT